LSNWSEVVKTLQLIIEFYDRVNVCITCKHCMFMDEDGVKCEKLGMMTKPKKQCIYHEYREEFKPKKEGEEKK